MSLPENSESPGEIPLKLRQQFLYLFAVALSDFQMHPSEIQFLSEFGKAKGVSAEAIEHMLLDPIRFDEEIPESVLERIECLYMLAQIIWADGKATKEERDILVRFSSTFEFAPENVEAIADFLIERAKTDTPVKDVLAQVAEQL